MSEQERSTDPDPVQYSRTFHILRTSQGNHWQTLAVTIPAWDDSWPIRDTLNAVYERGGPDNYGMKEVLMIGDIILIDEDKWLISMVDGGFYKLDAADFDIYSRMAASSRACSPLLKKSNVHVFEREATIAAV